ncbi:MAG: phosphoenolpyruvate--protein phosphotransferase [Myxococcales bacterium]|nr:phosphoenolpyruvate--protein phosphotransferase [Myxococcales bacterium]
MTPAAARRFDGIAVSSGVAVGRVYRLSREVQRIPRRTISEHEVDREIARFELAIAATADQLDRLLHRMRAAAKDGILIVEAHRMMLQDVMLVDGTKRIVAEQLLNAEAALERNLAELAAAFQRLQEQYFQERGNEIRFVGDQIMANLLGNYRPPSIKIPAGAVVVARELSPTEALDFTSLRIAGIVTEVGGMASHTAIMARAMEIPAVLGVRGVVDAVADDQTIIVDGIRGTVVIDPPVPLITTLREEQRLYRSKLNTILANRERPAETKDGEVIQLLGNIEYLEEVESLWANGGEGIGLYRTEYLFLTRGGLPDEETQFREYRRIIESVAPNVATLRTLDVGGDKIAAALNETSEDENPALGLRGVRLTLAKPALLKTQLRAALRAGGNGNMRLMIPFVTSIQELRRVRKIVARVAEDLAREGCEVPEDISLGCMIELPSAAMIADAFAAEADFLSIGTNDLIQYTLAVDRNNHHVADYYRPLHPAVLRLIQRVTSAARAAGKPVSICGEMAGVPLHTPLLVGFGFDSFSMNPASIPLVKELILACRADSCRELAEELTTLTSEVEVHARLREYHFRELGDLLSELVPSGFQLQTTGPYDALR